MATVYDLQYKFDGFEHGFIRIYAKSGSSSSSPYTRLVGTISPADTEIHTTTVNLYTNELKFCFVANNGYQWTADSRVYVGGINTQGSDYIDKWNTKATTDTNTLQEDHIFSAGQMVPFYFTSKSSPTPIATTTYTLKQNLSNCTSNIADGEINSGDKLEFTLTANDGYYFHSTGTVTNGDNTTTISATDDSTVTFTVDSVQGDVTVNMEAEAKPITYDYTEDLHLCSSDYKGDTITAGEHTITLTATSDYKFKQAGTLTVGSTVTEIVPSYTNKQVITIANVDGAVNISMTAVRATEYSFTQNLTNCTSDYDKSVIDYGDNVITLTAKDGYVFNTNGYYTTQTTRKTLIASGTSTQVCNLTVTGITKLYFTANKIPTSYTYTEYLENCTSDYTDETITEGSHTITLTATDGFIFSANGTYTVGGTEYTIGATGSNTVSFTVNVTGAVVVNMTAEVKPATKYSYQQNLSNCTSNYNDSEITEGTHVIVFTASEGYQFTLDGIMYIGSISYTIPASNTNVVTVSVNATADVIITLEAEVIPVTTYTIKQNLSNCSSNYSGDTIAEGQHTITLTANDGYIFNTKGALIVGSSSIDISPSGTDTQEVTFRANGNVIITMTANVKVETLSSFNHLYSVDDDILNKVSKIRYYSSDTAYGDYGSYITNLYQLPFDLSGMVTEEANIVLGYYQSSIPAPQVNGYLLNVDLGVIDCSMPYENVYDYDTCECTLIVPYFDLIKLDVRDCINKVLKLKLVIDLYSGYGNLIVTADETLIYVADKLVVRKIPFVQEKTGILLTQDVLTYNATLTAKVVVTNNTPYPHDNTFGNSCNTVVTIGEVSGYAEFDSVNISSSKATDTEIDEIEALLKSGVVIK